MDITKKISAHPYALLAAATVLLWLITRCSIRYMSALSAGLLMGCLGVFLAVYLASCLKASLKIRAISSASGLMLAFVFGFAAGRLTDGAAPLGMFGPNAHFLHMLLIGGLLLTAAVLAALIYLKKAGESEAVFLIFVLAFWLRIIYVLYMPITHAYQHDMAFFDDEFYKTHDTYILYFLNHWKLIDQDIRGLGQFYHPPLHYFLAALTVKINSLVFPSQSGNFEVIKALTLFCSSASGIVIYKILKFFEIKGPGLVMAMVFSLFMPEFIILSASVNNDSISVFFAFLAVLEALLWFRSAGLKHIILTAAAIGLSMMSKLSGGMIAVPVAFIFLVKLIMNLRSGSVKKDISLPRLIGQFAIFAAVVFPLGLWFPVRNMIKWGVPVNYVNYFEVSEIQDLSGYSVLERILLPAKGLSKDVPFLLFNREDKDYQIWEALFKTALFDEKMFQNDPGLMLTGSVMLLLLKVIVTVSAVSLVFFTIKAFKSGKFRSEVLAMLVLTVTEIVSYTLFCLKYEAICTMNIRYVVPLMIPFVIALGYGISALYDRRKEPEIKGLLSKIAFWLLSSATILFALLSTIFNGTYWTYYVAAGAGLLD